MKNTIQRIIQVPLEELQTEQAQSVSRGHAQECLICGKEIKGEPRYFVHLLTNGNIVSYDGADIEGSQGLFPVGAECAKKLVIQFAFDSKPTKK